MESARQLFPLAHSDLCMLCCRHTRVQHWGWALNGLQWLGVASCPLSPCALSPVGGEGARRLPCQPHSTAGVANQKQSQALFPLSTHGPGSSSSSRTWASAQRPSGRASPADGELHSLMREVAFTGCLWSFCKMKGHGPACPSTWIKPHISPLAI